MRQTFFAQGLLLASASLLGCTQTLDFDSVSNGTTQSSPSTFKCATLDPQPTFCDDFDGLPPLQVWSAVPISPATGGGRVSGDTLFSVSAPASLLATTAATAAGVYVSSAAQKTFNDFEGKPVDVRIAFDMLVESMDPTPGARVVAFQFLFGPLAQYNQLVINLTSTGAGVSSQFTENLGGAMQGTTKGDTQQVPAVKKWVHVTFDLEVFNPSGQGNNAKVTVDGVKLFDSGLHYPLYRDQPRLEIGVPWVDTTVTTQPWAIRYDNFQATLSEKR